MPSGRINANPVPRDVANSATFAQQTQRHLQELKNALNAQELSTILIEDDSRVVQDLKLFALMIS